MNKKDIRKVKGILRQQELENIRKYGPQHGNAGVHTPKTNKKPKYKEKFDY